MYGESEQKFQFRFFLIEILYREEIIPAYIYIKFIQINRD